jgi:hypothetical protein
MFKIAVYAPMKNEAANVKDWVACAKDADYLVVADMQSTDGTGELIYEEVVKTEERRAIILTARMSINPWRFDDAHNAALSLVPADAEVCIPLHGDERLREGWRAVIESVWQEGVTNKLLYPYQFHPDLTFMQNRIHGRNGFRWLYADHEGLYGYFGKVAVQACVTGEPLVVQHQDRTKDRSGILTRLRFAAQENPQSARVAFYLGRELMYAKEWAEALTHLHRYFKLPEMWPGEARQVAECMAACYRALEAARK